MSHSLTQKRTFTEQEAIEYVLKKYRELINENGFVLSLLYDLNLLPEQIDNGQDARKLQAICTLFEEQLAKDNRIAELEAALKAIIDRSNNDPLGTSKVIDMRNKAIAALQESQP